MKHTVVALLGIAALASAAEQGRSPADIVGALRGKQATYDDWKPVLALGKPAIPELHKLLQDPNHFVRAQAAILLYRLGEAAALDTMAALLGSTNADARREAALGLLTYVGEPMDFDADAPDADRDATLARWNAWWKANRDAALARKPMAALFGKILASDANSSLCAISPAGRHGVRPDMVFQVQRGDDFVCQLGILAAPARGAVGRVVPFSARTVPRVGDRVFLTAQP